MNKISVIGAGTMGNGIAHVFAQKGYQVSLVDVSQDALNKGLSAISKNLDRMVVKEKITVEEKEKTLSNIRGYNELEAGVKDADLVIEAATENVTIKLNIFKDLDKICMPHTILASNTSSISITMIASVTKRADKIIGMHFMNPVPIMKLVEIIKGYST